MEKISVSNHNNTQDVCSKDMIGKQMTGGNDMLHLKTTRVASGMYKDAQSTRTEYNLTQR